MHRIAHGSPPAHTVPMRRTWWCGLMALAAVVSVVGAQGQDGERARPEDTEVWQPVPPVVDPGPAPAPVPPPSDAIVLFDGTGLDQWVNVRDGGPAGWTVHDGVMTVQKSTGSIETRRRFRNYQILTSPGRVWTFALGADAPRP
jgi:hypothetical protein